MRRRRDLRRWLAGVLLLLLPLAGAWWWLGLSERAGEAAHALSSVTLPVLFDGRVTAVVAQSDGSWKIRTTLPLTGTSGTQVGVFYMGKRSILKGALSFPLMWALLIMTHRPWWRRLAWGTVLLAGVVMAQILASVWLNLTVMLKAQPSFVAESFQPPPYLVSDDWIGHWEWGLSNFTYYFTSLLGPVVAPLLVWAVLSRRGLLRLWVCFRRG